MGAIPISSTKESYGKKINVVTIIIILALGLTYATLYIGYDFR